MCGALAQDAKNFNETPIGDLSSYAATTLLFYDYFLTFSSEVKCVWRAKLSGATFIFLIHISWRTQSRDIADHVGGSLLKLQAPLTFSTVRFAIFTALRLYAIWSRNRFVFLFVMAVSLVSPAVDIYYYALVPITAAPTPLIGCGEITNFSKRRSTFPPSCSFKLFSPTSAILANVVVLVLTWLKTAGILRSLKTLKVKTSMGLLLLRDGSIYFILLCALNVLLALPCPHVNNAANALADVVISILVSRFILNLRKVYLTNHPSVASTFHSSRFSSLRFANSLTGNLGAPLTTLTESITPGPDGVSAECEDDDKEEGEVYTLDPMLVGLPVLDEGPTSTRGDSEDAVEGAGSSHPDADHHDPGGTDCRVASYEMV
ncbi:hypothetical protein EIP91_010238 [Steccherinum ochraceum]|uniref:DUF6533 domain-containing protein n=1 Tax=Steccherinum ochraceum TaxID=92696 RepID=A0A4R0R662_9APHY|nr:hypothetical protein EIP91_010238 [Steccherinum ochraceum]